MLFLGKKGGDKQSGNKTDKTTAGKLRLQSDLTEYNEDKIKGIDIKFPDPNNIMAMTIVVEPPKETLYAGGAY